MFVTHTHTHKNTLSDRVHKRKDGCLGTIECGLSPINASLYWKPTIITIDEKWVTAVSFIVLNVSRVSWEYKFYIFFFLIYICIYFFIKLGYEFRCENQSSTLKEKNPIFLQCSEVNSGTYIQQTLGTLEQLFSHIAGSTSQISSMKSFGLAPVLTCGIYAR